MFSAISIPLGRAFIPAVLSCVITSAALADATCSETGPAPEHVNPELAPKILKWVAHVEQNYKLPAPTSKAEAVQLQDRISTWEYKAQPETVDALFRAAVVHGVNVQYESLMIRDDPKHAKEHKSWVNIEAARAAACLDLFRLP